jgi:hypothetical protein
MSDWEREAEQNREKIRERCKNDRLAEIAASLVYHDNPQHLAWHLKVWALLEEVGIRMSYGEICALVDYLFRERYVDTREKTFEEWVEENGWDAVENMAGCGATPWDAPPAIIVRDDWYFSWQIKMKTSAMKVFLCHATDDQAVVQKLYQRLLADGINPWFSEKALLPGQDWHLEIRKAVETSDAIVICLSPRAVSKKGFIQKEIKYAIDVAEEQPEGTIFIIPLLLEPTVVPHRLRQWQWCEFYNERGYEFLMNSLKTRAMSININESPNPK